MKDNKEKIPDNCVIIDLETREQRKGRLIISEEEFERSATVLTNILLDYVRKGGDINDMTPHKVFGREKELNDEL